MFHHFSALESNRFWPKHEFHSSVVCILLKTTPTAVNCRLSERASTILYNIAIVLPATKSKGCPCLPRVSWDLPHLPLINTNCAQQFILPIFLTCRNLPIFLTCRKMIEIYRFFFCARNRVEPIFSKFMKLKYDFN